MKRQLSVITSNRRVQRHVTRALVSADWAVEHCAFDRGLVEGQLAAPADLYIVDGDEDLGEIRWVLDRIAERAPRSRSLVLSHETGDRIVLELFASTRLSNFVGRHGAGDGSGEMQDFVDEGELIATCTKLCGEREIFGISKYMPTWGMQQFRNPIRSTEEKVARIEQLEQFLQQIDCYRGIVPAIALVGEELIMNGLFNAPRDAAGKPKYHHLDRRRPLTVEPDEAVEFTFACDGRYVGLAVADRFGSLDREHIVSTLEQCYREAQAARATTVSDVVRGSGPGPGAGLGLYMVFNSVTQLVLNLQPGQRTEVIALFYVRSGARAFKASGRSLNIFSA